jgi:hypothetical protein
VSSVPVYCRQRNCPGLMWTATMKSLVGYAGPLERDHSPDGDFNRRVIAIASQPFWVCGRHGSNFRRHVPDFLWTV